MPTPETHHLEVAAQHVETTREITEQDCGPVVRQADSDEQLIMLWLHGRSVHTQRAYRADAHRMLRFIGKPLSRVTLGNLQSFADDLEALTLKPRSKHRVLSATKSLFAFGHRLGYLAFDTAKPLHLQTLRDELSERILDEGQVQRMIALERHPRNHCLLMLLYGSGVRVSEICGLRQRDCQARDTGGQITVLGKGGRTRTIKLPPAVWDKLMRLRSSEADDDAMFISRKGGALRTAQVTRIVRKAAERAGIPKGGLRSLAAARPCVTRIGPTGSHPSRAADARARQRGDHGAISTRPPNRFVVKLSLALSHVIVSGGEVRCAIAV